MSKIAQNGVFLIFQKRNIHFPRKWSRMKYHIVSDFLMQTRFWQNSCCWVIDENFPISNVSRKCRVVTLFFSCSQTSMVANVNHVILVVCCHEYLGMPKVLRNEQSTNISGRSRMIVLMFYIQTSIKIQLWLSFSLAVVRHVQTFPKVLRNNKFLDLGKESSYCLNFLHAERRNESYKLILLFWLGVVRLSPACAKCSE